MTTESQDFDVYDISKDRDAYLSNVYSLIFQYVTLCFLGHVVSMGLSWKFAHTYRKPEPEGKYTKFGSKLIGNTWQKRVSWDLSVNSGLYCAVLGYWYFRACWSLITDFLYNARNGSWLPSRDAESLEARWAQTDYYTVNSLSLHMATQIYEFVIYVLVDKPTVFYAHHVAVVATMIPTLFGGRIHRWFCIFAIAEATNVPLVIYTLMSRVPGMKNTTFYVINGFCLWLSFTVCRLHVGWATAAWCYEAFIWEKTAFKSPTVMFPSHPRLSFVWQVILVTLTLFLWSLSLMWYQKITVGMLKAIGLISGSKQSVE